MTFIVCLRAPGLDWDFRSTDPGTRFSHDFSAEMAYFSLNGTAFGGKSIEITATASKQTFSAEDVWVPTVRGFQNNPGCAESFSAEIKVT
mmetsp:Transcript_16155/g.40754  ORF Transcript_16155/g.40754 Transcript_16155/m.40754 type:complete len:90 (-) Transcript_16155:13-282(-)